MRIQKVIISRHLFLFTALVSVCLTGGCTRSDTTTPLSLSAIRAGEEAYPLVILGGGVGGLTAALYSLQAQVPTLLLEGSKPGGALTQSHSVRNWPGIQDAPGTDIIASIKKQVLQAGATIATERVTSVDFSQWPRIIHTASTQGPSITKTVKALSVIIATGTEPNLLGIPGEHELWGRGVSNCAVCDGALFKNKRVVVVGGGDAAITEAAYLADIAQEVVITVRKDSFRAKDTKQRDAVLARSNVKVLYNTQLKQIHGNQHGVVSVLLHNNQTLGTDGVFLAIGSQPNTKLFKDQLTLDARGFITLAKHQESSLPGIFAVGDVCDSEFVQAVTAAGDGCKAALQAIGFLKGIGYTASALSRANALRPSTNSGGAEQEVRSGRQSDKESNTKKQTKPLIMSSSKYKTQVLNDARQESKSGSKEHAGTVLEIKTPNDIDRLITTNKLPVVLDVFATWCGPCQQMAPVVDALAKKYAGKVTFVKLNIENPTGAFDATLKALQARGVQSVPSFLFISDGKEQKRLVGGMRAEAFEQTIIDTFGLA